MDSVCKYGNSWLIFVFKNRLNIIAADNFDELSDEDKFEIIVFKEFFDSSLRLFEFLKS